MGGGAPGRAPGLSITAGSRMSQPGPKLLHLEKPGQAPLRLPGRAWRWGPWSWGGGALCACVSGPYLFSPLLILVPPAAPHTKPHSPNPQGVGKGGQLYSAALFRASYPCSSAGSSQQCWPWCPQPCTGHCLRSALERVPASFSFPSQAGALCLLVSWWWTHPGRCPWALRGR